MIDQLFIYGTLIPGEERWHFLEPFVAAGTSPVADTTTGHVYDTDLGYPAARFDCTNTIGDVIEGMLISLDPSTLTECMELLDEVEGEPEGEYHRIIIDTGSGARAWSYQYGLPLDGLRRIRSGSWLRRDADTAVGDAMISFAEGRVIGAMIEKQLSTPQGYPLTLNALVSACNQKSSREPQTDFSRDEIAAVLDEAKGRKLCRFVHPQSGHGVIKYRHVLDEFLGLIPHQAPSSVADQLSLLGVLMLRGPQTLRELRDRTERLFDFGDVDAVEACMAYLASLGLVEELERQVGQRDNRWRELLTPAR